MPFVYIRNKIIANRLPEQPLIRDSRSMLILHGRQTFLVFVGLFSCGFSASAERSSLLLAITLDGWKTEKIHLAHQRAAGYEARGDERAAVEARLVERLVRQAGRHEPCHQTAFKHPWNSDYRNSQSWLRIQRVFNESFDRKSAPEPRFKQGPRPENGKKLKINYYICYFVK